MPKNKTWREALTNTLQGLGKKPEEKLARKLSDLEVFKEKFSEDFRDLRQTMLDHGIRKLTIDANNSRLKIEPFMVPDNEEKKIIMPTSSTNSKLTVKLKPIRRQK